MSTPFSRHLAGLRLIESGEHEHGLRMLRQSIELAPHIPDFHINLAAVLGSMGDHASAVTALHVALKLAPQNAKAHYNLSVALERLDRLTDAAQAGKRAAELRADVPDHWRHLAKVLQRLHCLDESAEAIGRLIALAPDDASARRMRGGLLLDLGDAQAAFEELRQAAEFAPIDSSIVAARLYAAHFAAFASPQTLADLHRAWADRFARPLYPTGRVAFANDPGPDRPLRVGYVSAELYEHPGARFIEPVLTHHDRTAVEAIVYCDVRRPDAVTTRLRGLLAVRQWRDTAALSDEDLVRQFRSDRIDITVEAVGHMAGGRLLAFARRAAPIQITWPGYVNTTGLSTMDYCLTDDLRDPPGADALWSERLIRVPVSAQAYAPSPLSPPVGPPPVEKHGHITFGCFNQLAKMTPEVAAAWAAILQRVPGSKLMLLVHQGDTKRTYPLSQFARHGIGPDRLILLPRRSPAEYLALHHEVDLTLDPWPFNGHTTMLDSLWMGVPAVALEGDAHVSREGAAVLRLVGLDELVAHSVDQYIQLATALANDRPRLSELRRTLRPRMAASPLLDHAGLCRRIESVYRQVWERWCASQSR